MTSLATIVGLLPMALKLETGSEAYAPLARVIIVLPSSVLLTIFVVPAAYLLIYQRRGTAHPLPAGSKVRTQTTLVVLFLGSFLAIFGAAAAKAQSPRSAPMAPSSHTQPPAQASQPSPVAQLSRCKRPSSPRSGIIRRFKPPRILASAAKEQSHRSEIRLLSDDRRQHHRRRRGK